MKVLDGLCAGTIWIEDCTISAVYESSADFWQYVYMESPRLPGGFKTPRRPKEPKTFVLGQGSMIVELDDSF